MNLPPAIIFINNEFNSITQTKLVTQLYINEVITKVEFDYRVSIDSNYAESIKLNFLTILVLLSDYSDATNRTLADIVLFFKQGMLTVELNKYGPPAVQFPIDRINIYELLRSVGSSNVTILPSISANRTISLGGIIASQLNDPSGVHSANPDNLYNNIDFINRKS